MTKSDRIYYLGWLAFAVLLVLTVVTKSVVIAFILGAVTVVRLQALDLRARGK